MTDWLDEKLEFERRGLRFSEVMYVQVAIVTIVIVVVEAPRVQAINTDVLFLHLVIVYDCLKARSSEFSSIRPPLGPN